MQSFQNELDAQGYDYLDMELQWGTIPRSIVTLIQLYSDDGSVSGIMRPMGEIAPMTWVFFVIFMAVVSLGLMELLAAVFVDSLLEEKTNREKVLHILYVHTCIM